MFLFSLCAVGSPLKWRNIEFNTTTTIDDPVWKELIMWSNETLGEGPLLTTIGRNRSISRIPSPEEIENETIRQFESLKVGLRFVLNFFLNLQ